MRVAWVSAHAHPRVVVQSLLYRAWAHWRYLGCFSFFPSHGLSTSRSFFFFLFDFIDRRVASPDLKRAFGSPHQSSESPPVCSSPPPHTWPIQRAAFKGRIICFWTALSCWATLQSCGRTQTQPAVFSVTPHPHWISTPTQEKWHFLPPLSGCIMSGRHLNCAVFSLKKALTCPRCIYCPTEITDRKIVKIRPFCRQLLLSMQHPEAQESWTNWFVLFFLSRVQ